MQATRATVEDRFWAKVRQDGDCWTWIACTSNRGYGWFKFGPDSGAHRVAWRLLRCDIPDGLHIDHLCRNVACVNPWHMDLVTVAVNNQRAAVAQTRCRHGHDYDETNTAYDRHGHRYCRACAREKQRRLRGEGRLGRLSA